MTIRKAALIAAILSATALAGCVVEDPYPSYPQYSAAYPGYYPNYYAYPEYSVGVGIGYGGRWHDHGHDRHWR